MEVLRRRAQQLAKIVDARRQAAGLPSVLDLRPNHGPFVGWLLQAFHDLASFDGWSGRAEIPYERMVTWSRENEVDLALAQPAFRSLTGIWNRFSDERREEARKK